MGRGIYALLRTCPVQWAPPKTTTQPKSHSLGCRFGIWCVRTVLFWRRWTNSNCHCWSLLSHDRDISLTQDQPLSFKPWGRRSLVPTGRGQSSHCSAVHGNVKRVVPWTSCFFKRRHFLAPTVTRLITSWFLSVGLPKDWNVQTSSQKSARTKICHKAGSVSLSKRSYTKNYGQLQGKTSWMS